MKTDRAKEYLDELDRCVPEFVENPFSITRKDYDKKHRHVIRCEFKPVPTQIAMLAGEFAYSLRSGLDQLAWQLAWLNVKPKRPRTHTCFPIASIMPPKGFGDKTRDILPAAIRIIESLQPYKRGAAFKDHPLYLLNELCIVDKHEFLPMNSTAGRIGVAGAPYTLRNLKYGFEVHVALTDKYRVQLQSLPGEIIFGEPIGITGGAFEIRYAAFRTIHDFVRNDVIPRFEGLFK